jgi:rifampicin phosphotransferase
MSSALDGHSVVDADGFDSSSVAGDSAEGNKARGLRLLQSNGYAVPDFFVLRADEPLDEAGLWQRVAALRSLHLDSHGGAALAVRSSSAAEDSARQSGAGQFASLLSSFGPDDLMLAVKDVQASAGGHAIPVIVQVAIDAQFSGVAFSCDPVSFDREPFLVSWVRGNGQDLVSGRTDGSLLVARSATDVDGQWPGQPETLAGLIGVLRAMEREFGQPADVEWAIDHARKLWLLQARPVVLVSPERTDALSAAELSLLPPVVAGHSKMRLRAAASRAGVPMSAAVVLTTAAGQSPPPLPATIPAAGAAALSIVLLHPCQANGKVHREFAQVGSFDVPFFTHGCRRYAIRRYPQPDSAAAVAADVLQRGLDSSWLASVVVQEIYDAAATGIVRRLDEDYVAELAVGHFLPKGVVDPSLFIVSQSGQVLESHRLEQDVAYRFINGHVVTERPVEEQFTLSDAEVAKAVLDVAPLFAEYPKAALEFGVLRSRAGEVTGYVIDMAEADSHTAAGKLDRELIRDGVLSPGRAEGIGARICNAADGDLDMHLLEDFDGAGQLVENVVFIADRASVDLLPLVSRCGRNTAFVFRHGSLLAHLSIVLRERGIPALSLKDDELFGKLTAGAILTVEAAAARWVGPRVT